MSNKPHAAPRKPHVFNTSIVSLNPPAQKSESWWILPRYQQDRAEFMAKASARHPSGVGAPYRRVEE